MAIYHRNFEQKSAAWFAVRAGIPTASNFHRIVTPGGKASTQAEGYMNYLLTEWYLGRSLEDETYQSEWMARGNDLEQAAIEAYEFATGLETEECAFITSDDGLIGCSPDRLVGKTRGAEIKCSKPQNHMAQMRNPSLDDKHRCQVQGCLWLSEREQWDVVGYHPQLPLVIVPVNRNEEYISKLEAGLRAFVDVMLKSREDLVVRFGPRIDPVSIEKPQEWGEEFNVSEADLDERAAAYVKELQS
jgi:hypothetical protein